MSETEQLDILIRSIADGTGFTTSATQARAMNAEMAALGGGFSHHGATITAAERDISREADSMARALGAAGETGGKAISRFESLGATIGSSGALGIGIGAALVGLTAVYEVGKSAIENSDKLEASTRSLSQAYDSQGQSLANQGAWIGKFLETNRRYIDDQYATRTAIAELVRAGYDNVQVQRISNDALDLAAARGGTYEAAVSSISKALQGSTIGLRELGLSAKDVSAIMGEATKENKELASANKALATDTEHLTKAQEALNVENDRLKAKHNLTAVDYDMLHEKQKAVADLTTKVTADQNALADAQGHVATTAEMQANLLDKLEPKLKDARKATTELHQSQDDLKRSAQDTTAMLGPGLSLLASTGLDILNLSIQASVLAGQHPDRIPRAFGFGGNGPTSAEGTPLNTPRTQQNLLGNPELDRTHIDETTRATQRQAEWQDRLGAYIAATAQAQHRQGEITDATTNSFKDETEEVDRMMGHSRALTAAMYDLNVEHGSVSTRITEVLGKWRDESDAMDRFKYHGSDALTQTQVVFDGFVKHIRSEKLDLDLTVSTEAAQAKVNDFLERVRESRANIQVGATSAGNLGTLFSP